MPSSDADTILAVENLTKDFAAVRALDDVGLSFRRGEVHGIVGENGAGKSTLMKIISGLYRPTSGRLVYRGEPVEMTDPARAMHMGIAMVHQELNLVDELSVADNVFLGRELTRLGLVRRSEMAAEASDLLARVGCTANPHARLGSLPIAQQQMVEIAKSLSYDASVLIMDEPTAVLARPDVERLFSLIGRLKEEGVTVLYISHILPEVLRICDRITVMRDGRIVRTLERAGLGDGKDAEARLASLMVGRPLADHFPDKGRPGDEVLLQVEGLCVPGHVKDVSFEVRAGEVLGFAGLVGAGRTEMAEAVAGLRGRSAGTVRAGDTDLPPLGPLEAVRSGIAYLSEDRRGRGLTMGRSVIENITLVSLERYCVPLISHRREHAAAERHVRRLSIRLGRPTDPIDMLSGGNQQKVALAKWLEVEPRVLLLDEPTRGVDIGAKEEIYRLIHELAGRGMGCVFISSELNELLGTCNRIAVMRGGHLVAVLEGDDMTEEEVMLHAAGVKAGSVA
jgi:ribose transport system ATP-binding protein